MKTVLLMVSILCFSAELFADKKTSLYDAKLGEWIDDSGKKISLKSFRKRKVVMTMAYTSCESACPLIVKKLKSIDLKLQQAGAQADFVVVSFDSKFDNPKKMSMFRKHQNIADSRWHLLLGNEKDTRFLANLLEIRFSRNPKDQTISHDNKIILLNENGEIVKSLEGLSTDSDEKLYE